MIFSLRGQLIDDDDANMANLIATKAIYNAMKEDTMFLVRLLKRSNEGIEQKV